MFAIIGIIVVFGAIVGGYLMEHGNLKVLVQPAELIIIGGAALGTILIANPLATVMRIVKGLIGVLKPSPYSTLPANMGPQSSKPTSKIRKKVPYSPSIRSSSATITPCISFAIPCACTSPAASAPLSSIK